MAATPQQQYEDRVSVVRRLKARASKVQELIERGRSAVGVAVAEGESAPADVTADLGALRSEEEALEVGIAQALENLRLFENGQTLIIVKATESRLNPAKARHSALVSERAKLVADAAARTSRGEAAGEEFTRRLLDLEGTIAAVAREIADAEREIESARVTRPADL